MEDFKIYNYEIFRIYQKNGVLYKRNTWNYLL